MEPNENSHQHTGWYAGVNGTYAGCFCEPVEKKIVLQRESFELLNAAHGKTQIYVYFNTRNETQVPV